MLAELDHNQNEPMDYILVKNTLEAISTDWRKQPELDGLAL